MYGVGKDTERGYIYKVCILGFLVIFGCLGVEMTSLFVENSLHD